MFAHKEIKKQNKAIAFSTQKRHEKGESGSPIEAGNLPGSTRFLQRNLGNSYMQSIVSGGQTLEQTTTNNSAPKIQRKCSCGGTCASCSAIDDEKKRIQAKLKIGPVNDVYEQEADRVADQVMRMSEPQSPGLNEKELIQTKPLARQITPLGHNVQRQCTECEEEIQRQPLEEEELIQAKKSRDVTPEITPAISSGIQSLQGGGRPLSGLERGFFEPRFGVDFSQVSIYDNSTADCAARSINANAYTHNNNVVFRSGEHQQDSKGRWLMAHELTHVLQQTRRAAPDGQIQRACGRSIGTPPECDEADVIPVGERFLFQVNCDDFLHGAEDRRLEALADDIAPADHVNVHGFASPDGPAEFNLRLSCARAYAIRNGLIGHGVGIGQIDQTFAHGETNTAGEVGLDRSGVVEPDVPTLAVECADGRTALERNSACIQPVVIANDDGSDPTVAPNFDIVRTIWGQCCIDITVNPTITVAGTRFKEIEDAGSGAPPTAEEQDMFDEAGETDCVEVFFVETIRRGAVAGRLVAGGGTTKGLGTADSKIIMVDGGNASVVAHELGHSFGLLHDANGVMNPSGSPDVAVSDEVNNANCTDARANVNTTTRGGGNDCCRLVNDT